MPKVILGIDIGTTSLCAAALERESERVLWVCTRQNDAACPAREPWRREQDPRCILAGVHALISAATEAGIVPDAIALTGQMHGIVYLGGKGSLLSPLFTWQDGRGGLPLPGRSAAERLGIPEGYGFATHLYMAETGAVPPGAESLCMVMDYVALELTGETKPLMHTTNAASLGLFDMEKGCFAPLAGDLLVGTGLRLPRVTNRVEPVGEYRRVPVYCAIGDNQAAFRAAAGEGDVLLNFGTGSQVSLLSETPEPMPGLEMRPYLCGRFIHSGSALCGGRAYAALADCFAAMDRARGLAAEGIYETLGELAEAAYAAGEYPTADTAFAGTRQDPARRGAFTGIRISNLTPGGLAVAILRGMVEELYQMYKTSGARAERLVLSGNAARKNPLLCRLAEARFELPARLCPTAEEAAVGAALAAGEEMQ